MASGSKSFSFKPSLMKFLKELAKNNNRDWFQANKPRYEEQVLEPALAFLTALEAPFKKRVSPYFKVIAKRSGGSLMRIYRDTRFSKDKTPYKTNVGIHIRHELGKDVHAPGFYFHIEPDEIFVGAGVWHPDSSALFQIREHIVDSDLEWSRIVNSRKIKATFSRPGDTLKRPPRDFDADHPLIEDLKRKDHFLLANFTAKQLQQPDIVKQTIDHFVQTKPFVRFLCEALQQPF
jgi:uncharacterized protein (TIGR02453 family)